MREQNSKLDIEAIAANDHFACLRQDGLTAQKIEVGVIFQEMLGTPTAADYLSKNKIPIDVALRVLTKSRRKATN